MSAAADQHVSTAADQQQHDTPAIVVWLSAYPFTSTQAAYSLSCMNAQRKQQPFGRVQQCKGGESFSTQAEHLLALHEEAKAAEERAASMDTASQARVCSPRNRCNPPRNRSLGIPTRDFSPPQASGSLPRRACTKAARPAMNSSRHTCPAGPHRSRPHTCKHMDESDTAACSKCQQMPSSACLRRLHFCKLGECKHCQPQEKHSSMAGGSLSHLRITACACDERSSTCK